MVSNEILNKCVKKQRKPTNLKVTEDRSGSMTA